MTESGSPQRERIIVQPSELNDVLDRLFNYEGVVLDCETKGLNWAGEDEAFCIQIATPDLSAYFNLEKFPHYPDGVPRLDRRTVAQSLRRFLEDPERTIIGHNINFDVHMLEREGIKVACKLEDTLTRAQVLYNQHPKYSLEECLKRIGREKGDVMTYIEENGLYKETLDPWSGQTAKDPDFTKLPWEIITEYGFTDVEETLFLYEHQEAQLKELYPQLRARNLEPQTLAIESGVASVLVGLERDGIRVDTAYAKEGMLFERGRCAEITAEFRALTGTDFVDSVEGIGRALEDVGVTLGRTPDGNPSMASWVLEQYSEIEVVRLVLEHRDRLKRGQTYFSNILRYSDKNGFLHASFRSRGAYATGRMSGSKPNLQNITKGENCEFPVRKAFYPRAGNALIELDYKAQEFRLLLHYANELEMAQKIKDGYDPHQALADELSTTRDKAKAIQFGKLYGMGAAKLAKMLGIDLDAAKLFGAQYFRKYPGIKNFTYKATDAARRFGYVHAWDGCRFYFPNPEFAYKAANAIIQGGCAAITKQGMINVSDYIRDNDLKTKIIVQVHDALVLDMPYGEFSHIDEMRKQMSLAFPKGLVPMETSVEHSFESWYSMSGGAPYGEKATGSGLSGPDKTSAESAA